MKKVIKLLCQIFILISLQACEDLQDPDGIETRIFGRIYDSQNQLPITGQQLKISEYNVIPSVGSAPNIEFIQHLDSTLTDSQGYYDFSFITSGQGDRYIMTFQFNEYFSLRGQDTSLEVESSGDDTELNFDFLHLYPVNLNITLDSDVQFLPISIDPEYPLYYPSSNDLTQTEIENTRLIYTDKNSNQFIKFLRRTSENQRQQVIINMPPTNSTELTDYEIYINDGDFVDY